MAFETLLYDIMRGMTKLRRRHPIARFSREYLLKNIEKIAEPCSATHGLQLSVKVEVPRLNTKEPVAPLPITFQMGPIPSYCPLPPPSSSLRRLMMSSNIAIFSRKNKQQKLKSRSPYVLVYCENTLGACIKYCRQSTRDAEWNHTRVFAPRTLVLPEQTSPRTAPFSGRVECTIDVEVPSRLSSLDVPW